MPTYTVRQGEDWLSLSMKLGVPLQNLLNLNPDIRGLSAGVGLRVPRVPARVNIPPVPGQGGGQTPKSGGKGFLQGQGPPRPEGKGGGRLPGGQLPIPPRYTPPAGKPFRPYQPPGGGKAPPPPPAPRLLPPQYKPGVQPRMILPPRPPPVFQSQRLEQALSATYPPAPRAPQAGAQATYPAPQWGGGYGATANLRAFPGARATATATPLRRRRMGRYGGYNQAVLSQWEQAPVHPSAAGMNLRPLDLAGGALLRGEPTTFLSDLQASFARPTREYPVHPASATGATPLSPIAQLPVTERLPLAATDAGEVQGADGNWYGFVRMHNALTDEPGHMYDSRLPPEQMYYEALVRGEPPPQMSEAVRIALGLTQEDANILGYEYNEKTGFWEWGVQEAEGPQTLGYGGGGGYGGGYGYYGGGGGGGGGGYAYSYPNYPTYEQQQQAYLPGRDRLPVGRFGLVSWQGI